jgi:orotidine-5'-phosphate decarboxylase
VSDHRTGPGPLVCLALDVASRDAAVDWVARLATHVDVFKIGLQLYCAEGPSIVRDVREAGARRVFLDLKLHDIPNTVAGAVRGLRGLGIDYLTLHVGGGVEMMRAAQAEAGSICLLGVTVLTSLDDGALALTGHTSSARALVARRARLAVDAGLGGLVCSPLEVAEVRASVGAAPTLVTPGIRLDAASKTDDQRRVATPEAAQRDGASMLVVGRPLLDAPDPVHVAQEIARRLGRL